MYCQGMFTYGSGGCPEGHVSSQYIAVYSNKPHQRKHIETTSNQHANKTDTVTHYHSDLSQ